MRNMADNKNRRSKKWYILYTLGIFSLAPLTLFILYGLGTLISAFANPSALGPELILVLVVVPLGMLYLFGKYSDRKGKKTVPVRIAKREPAE